MKLTLRNSRGFTIIEILISIAVLSVVVLGITFALNQYFKASAHTITALTNSRSANAILTRIADEVKYATEIIMPALPDGDSLDFKNENGNDRRFFIDNHNLYFNNGVSNVLISGNVKSIQFNIDNNDSKIVTIGLVITNGHIDYSLTTTVRLMNGSE